MAVAAGAIVLVILRLMQRIVHVNTLKRLEVQFIHRAQTLAFLNEYFMNLGVKVLDVDFHAESRPEGNLYTNLYTLSMPAKMSYVDVIGTLSEHPNIRTVRTRNLLSPRVSASEKAERGQIAGALAGEQPSETKEARQNRQQGGKERLSAGGDERGAEGEPHGLREHGHQNDGALRGKGDALQADRAAGGLGGLRVRRETGGQCRCKDEEGQTGRQRKRNRDALTEAIGFLDSAVCFAPKAAPQTG